MIIEAVLCAYFAQKKGRNPWLWGIGGFFTSWFGVATILIMPKSVQLLIKEGVIHRCPHCIALVPAGAKVCAYCTRDIIQ